MIIAYHNHMILNFYSAQITLQALSNVLVCLHVYVYFTLMSSLIFLSNGIQIISLDHLSMCINRFSNHNNHSKHAALTYLEVKCCFPIGFSVSSTVLCDDYMLYIQTQLRNIVLSSLNNSPHLLL